MIGLAVDSDLRNLVGQIETRDRRLPVFIGDGIYRPVEIAGCVVGRDDHRIDLCDIFGQDVIPDDLRHAYRRFAKNLPEDKEPELYDEIDKLGLAFTNMQTTLRENMESILELSLSEEKLKYQLLQSQINPHFLYNILGTIKTCQSIGRLDIAGQMITDLTQFYRLSLRKSGDRILIRDELEIARLYLNMEKLCHNETLSWEIHAEDGIENFLICRFTLQPFLENCILHGYSRTTPTIHIIVDVIYGDDDVIITICDNGIGIESEQLEELKNTLKNKTVDYEKHFGIGNVNKRISSPSFGNGTVEIDSIPGKGTQITITFAQMEE